MDQLRELSQELPWEFPKTNMDQLRELYSETGDGSRDVPELPGQSTAYSALVGSSQDKGLK